MVNGKRILLCSLLLSIALVLHFVESLLPPLIMIVGMKIGLANIITLIAFIFMSKKEAFLITILRIIIGSIMGGSPSSLLYSLSGGVTAFLVLLLLFPIFHKNIWVLSITAAIFHNIAQVFVAYYITGTIQVFLFLFPLTALAILSGTFTGITASYIARHKLFEKFY